MNKMLVFVAACTAIQTYAVCAETVNPYELPPLAKIEEFIDQCSAKLSASNASPPVLDPRTENQNLTEIDRVMKVEVIGQDPGVDALLGAIEIASAGLEDSNKPFSRNLFTGPTGVGKSETSRALVKALGGEPDQHLIQIDCGEFQQGHEISKLIGATASYVGYGDMGKLHPEELAKRKLPLKLASGQTKMVNVIMIDELEKCNDTVFRLLLGILDNGRATMGDNSIADFRDAIINATSNLGAREVEHIIRGKEERLRQMPPESAEQADLTGRIDQTLKKEIDSAYDKAIRDRFAPEFRNRWKAIIQYLHLGPREHAAILQKQLARVQRTIFTRGLIKVGLIVEPEVRDLMIRKGTNVVDGARPMENLLDVKLRTPLARLMVTGQINTGDVISMYVDPSLPDEIQWRRVASDLQPNDLVRFADLAYPGHGFAEFDWEKELAKADELAAAKSTTAQDIIAQLRLHPMVIRRLYLDVRNQPVSMRERRSHQEIEIRVKYARIGTKIIRIDFISHEEFKIWPEPSIPEKVKDHFPEEQLHVFNEDQVKALIEADSVKPQQNKPGPK